MSLTESHNPCRAWPACWHCHCHRSCFGLLTKGFSASLGGGRACLERAKHRADLNMGPFSAARGSHVALVEFGGNRIVARETSPFDLLDNRQHIAANCFAFAFTAAVPRFAALASCVLPGRVPRALVARRTALVRSEIISRSCSATAAKMCTVSLLACGLSTATNSTPDSMSAAIKARFRDNRSSFAMTSLALCFLQAA